MNFLDQQKGFLRRHKKVPPVIQTLEGVRSGRICRFHYKHLGCKHDKKFQSIRVWSSGTSIWSLSKSKKLFKKYWKTMKDINLKFLISNRFLQIKTRVSKAWIGKSKINEPSWSIWEQIVIKKFCVQCVREISIQVITSLSCLNVLI